MSRWITISACLSVLILTALSAHAAERAQMLRLAQADESRSSAQYRIEGRRQGRRGRQAQPTTRPARSLPKEKRRRLRPRRMARAAAPADAAARMRLRLLRQQMTRRRLPRQRTMRRLPRRQAGCAAARPPPPGVAAEGPARRYRARRTDRASPRRLRSRPDRRRSGADSPARRSLPSAILPRSMSAILLRRLQIYGLIKGKTAMVCPGRGGRRRRIMRPTPVRIMAVADMTTAAEAMAVAAVIDAGLAKAKRGPDDIASGTDLLQGFDVRRANMLGAEAHADQARGKPAQTSGTNRAASPRTARSAVAEARAHC